MLSTIACACLFAAVAQTADDPSLSNATEVRRFSFEEDEDQDYDLQPDDWWRRRGTGFPQYVRVQIDRKTAVHGKQSLKFELNGARAACYSPLVRVAGEHMYFLRGRIKSDGLLNDAAMVSVSLLDRTRKRIERLLSRPVTGTHKEWATVEIGPFRPPPGVRFLVVGCHIVQGENTDVRGSVWFDDLWLASMPLLELSCGERLNFFRSQERVTIESRVLGLAPGKPHRLVLALEDVAGNSLGRTQFDLQAGDGGGDGQDDAQAPLRWELSPHPNGFYRVRASLEREGAKVLSRETSFVVVDPPGEPVAGEFGWSSNSGAGDLRLADLADLAAQGGINWLKLPIWSRADVEPGANLSNSEMNVFLDRLDQHKISLVGQLSDPPTRLRDKFGRRSIEVGKILTMPREFWYPSLEPLIARYSFRIRHWQLGSDDDETFRSLTGLSQTITAIKREFDRIGHQTRIGVPWTWDAKLPADATLSRSFVTLQADPAIELDDLEHRLQEASANGPPRWVIVQPPRSGEPIEQRATSLARRMLAARLSGAEVIFAGDLCSPESGLLQADGAPTEMFLPWRTVALALRGSAFLGRFELPNSSPNFVFARGREVVVIIWNETPVREEFFFGVQAWAVDLWGRKTVLPVDSATGQQALDVGPMPVIVRGCSEPIARWRMALRLERGKIPSEFGQHPEAILGINTFPQGASARVTARFPAGWELDPAEWSTQVPAGETFRLPTLVTFPLQASLGSVRAAIDFEVVADRTYRFTEYRPFRLGLGDVELQVTSRRTPDGRLEIEQTIINSVDPPEVLDFTCSMFIPGRVRMRHVVSRLSKGEDHWKYIVSGADELEGKQLWLRCEQIDGRRVLNHHIRVQGERGASAP